ncbi:MAG: N-acetylneuraminate synthase family protein [Cyanobacteria bacterium P01_G01_bin.54]
MNPTFEINGRPVGANFPCYIIAEACDNHLGQTDVALEMIRQSKIAGADAIKFQHHLPDEEMLPESPMSDNFEEPLYEFLKKYALSLEQHKKLKKCCEDLEIQYICTPFSWKAAQELESIGVGAFKIGSGEMTDIPTLVRIAGFAKPIMISTGMSSFEEIDRTYNAIAATPAPLALMNCVSEYPPVYEDMNLGVIPKMLTRYPQAVIGHSDHTPDLYTSFAAVALGARIIEKHIILDKNQPGPDQSVSIDMQDLTHLVDGIRKVEVGLGDQKTVHAREQQIRTWAFRSLVSTCPIPAGTTITQDMIWSKRPGTGIPANQMQEVIGKTAARVIAENTLLAWEDIAG